MAEESQQKKSEMQSDGYEDCRLDKCPELVNSVTKVGQGSPEIGEAIQHLKSCLDDLPELVAESLKHFQTDTEPTVDPEKVGHCHEKGKEPKQKPKLWGNIHRERFLGVFPELVDGITKGGLDSPEIGEAMQPIRLSLENAVYGGKLTRGLMVIGSLNHLQTDSEPEAEKCALILGWCVELLQACSQAADDILEQSNASWADGILDQSKYSWGKQRWCVKDFIGLMLDSVIYEILKMFTRQEPYYLQVLELFHEVSYLSKIGKCLDIITTPENDVDLDRFSLEKFAAIAKYKTTFCSFYLPVGIAMYMAGICEEQAHKHAREILLQMGEFFQVQIDFLDCFGDPAETGKIGTDIEDSKCSWLVVQALARATPQQRSILEVNYGQKDPECVQRVKHLYQELKLEEAYHEYEEKTYARLLEEIAELQTLPEKMFLELLANTL